jgi:soluble lytic murein transglycosylase-like protein
MRGAATTVAVVGAVVALLVGGVGWAQAAIVSTSSTVLPLPPALPSARVALVADLNRAQQLIDSPLSSTGELDGAGRFEQLATVALVDQGQRLQHAVLDGLSAAAAAAIRTDLAAASALARLGTRHRSLPPWKIVAPPPPATLLGYFRQAQSRFGVPWEDLAAIEFVETRFGRVAGLSSAGAEGPMQFLPATWAAYGSGDVRNPRDAIMGAARYLAASGAPGDMIGALYHYNPSADYVGAVENYAGRMGADPRAYYGYFYWQVIFHKLSGRLVLPVGYPTVRPVALRALLGGWL